MKLELKAIRIRRQEWIDAINNNDLDKVSDLLSDDAVWMPPGMPALQGKGSIIEWMKPSFESFKHEYSITDIRIKGAGNWAVEQANFVSKLWPEDGGDATEHRGSYIMIWRWEKNNVWRIERYVDNSEVLEYA